MTDSRLFDPGPATAPTAQQRDLRDEALAITPELWAGVQHDPKMLADLIERLVLALDASVTKWLAAREPGDQTPEVSRG